MDVVAPGRSLRGSGPAVLGVFPGEGIGPEVIGAALKVLDAIESVRPLHMVRRTGCDIGTAANGDGKLCEKAAQFCQKIFDEGGAILCGPGGGRFVYDIRRCFDLYCKLVPLTPIPALQGASPLKKQLLKDIDILVVRDNAGGIYQGQWETRRAAPNSFVAEHRFSYSQVQVEQILKPAAELSKLRRGRIDVVIKDGGVPSISELWRSCANRIAESTGVECRFLNVDYAAYLMVQDPRRFDVLVTPNLFGDILADLGAIYLPSRGLSFSANFSASGHAVYQTGHGAAKDLVGTDRANPVGQILSMAMMLRESYGLYDEADLVEQAVESVYRAGYRTDDLIEPRCQCVGTRQMADLIAQAAASLGRAVVPA
jgi:3-isopropylmalate dehydrogenase